MFIDFHTLSAFPLNPTNVPRRVYRFCDADKETESMEYGVPTTWNLASVKQQFISQWLSDDML